MGAVGYLGGDPNKLDRAGYDQGDVPAADVTGVLVPVAIGTPGNVLTVNPVQPELLDYEPAGGGGGAVSSWNARTGAVVPLAGDYGVAQVTGAAPTASPTFTGIISAASLSVTGRTVQAVDTLADAATILVDAALGNQFAVTLGGNRTLGTPSNPPATGYTQLLLFAVRQDGAGNRTLTLSAGYRLGAGISAITLSTAGNKTDYIGARWNGTDSVWDVIAFANGY